MQVAKINAATAIMFRASFFPASRIGARLTGKVGVEMGRHLADGPYRLVARPRSRAVGASTAREIQPAGFPLRLSGVADWSSANASFQPSPGPADRQCRPLVPPPPFVATRAAWAASHSQTPQRLETGRPAGWFRCGVIFAKHRKLGALAGMAPASAVWRQVFEILRLSRSGGDRQAVVCHAPLHPRAVVDGAIGPPQEGKGQRDDTRCDT